MYVLTAVLEVYRSRTEFCTYLISVYSAVHDNLSVMQRERERQFYQSPFVATQHQRKPLGETEGKE
jgi:hypothetical protein